MSNQNPTIQGAVCPVPLAHKDKIVMGHGSGGKMTHDLIAQTFLPPLDNRILRTGDDAGVVSASDMVQNGTDTFRLAISTDSHVVSPLFFPGGDIGRLAICGTVNDITMMGAKPLYLTAGFILEEGLELEILERIVASMKSSADEAGVKIIAGDTKVVQKGSADGIFINTSGIGVISPGVNISGTNAQPGDVVIISGNIGDHGIAVLEARGELGFTSNITSDVAPLNHLVEAILHVADHQVHVLRDPTRGGLGTTLNEIALQSHICIEIEEELLPIRPEVNAACEMLGFDPLYIANEGKLIAIVSQRVANETLEVMRNSPYGKNAVIIGKITKAPSKRVLLKTRYGTRRVVEMLAGEMLPRIC